MAGPEQDDPVRRFRCPGCEQQFEEVVWAVVNGRDEWVRRAERWLRRLAVPDPAMTAEDAVHEVCVEAAKTLQNRSEPYPELNVGGFVTTLLRRICLRWMEPTEGGDPRPRMAEPPGPPNVDRDERLSDSAGEGGDPTPCLALADDERVYYERCRVVIEDLRTDGRLVVDRWGQPHLLIDKIRQILREILLRQETGQLVDSEAEVPAGGTTPYQRAVWQILVATAGDDQERRLWSARDPRARRCKRAINALLEQAWQRLLDEMRLRGWDDSGGCEPITK